MKLSRLTAMLLVAGLTLSSCGSGDSDDRSASPPNASEREICGAVDDLVTYSARLIREAFEGSNDEFLVLTQMVIQSAKLKELAVKSEDARLKAAVSRYSKGVEENFDQVAGGGSAVGLTRVLGEGIGNLGNACEARGIDSKLTPSTDP